MLLRTLPCELNEQTVHVLAEELATAVCLLDEQQEALRVEQTARRKRIKALQANISRLSRQIATGLEEKEVEVEDHKDFGRGVVVTVRLDTGEVIDERAMTPEDRQEELPEGRSPDVPNYVEAYRLADDAEARQAVKDELEEAIADIQADLGQAPLCGRVSPILRVAFGAVPVAAWGKALRLARQKDPELADRLAELVGQGHEMHDGIDIREMQSAPAAGDDPGAEGINYPDPVETGEDTF